MKTYLYLFSLLIFACPSFGQTGNYWSETDDFGGGQRERAVGFSLRGKGYVSCGLDTADMVRNDLWEYDPATASWTQKANMPGVGRRNAVGFTIGDYAYVGTGVDHATAPSGTILKDFWKYDPVSSITEKDLESVSVYPNPCMNELQVLGVSNFKFEI